MSTTIGLIILIGGCLFMACRPRKSLKKIDSSRGPHRDVYNSSREH